MIKSFKILFPTFLFFLANLGKISCEDRIPVRPETALNPSTIILEMRIYDGPEAGGYRTKMFLYQNGLIQIAQRKSPGTSKKAILGRLTTQALKVLRNKVEAIQNGPLVVANPQDPTCDDLPTINYLLRKKSGRRFMFAQWKNCHESYLKGNEARQLKEFLEGWDYLSPLEEKRQISLK